MIFDLKIMALSALIPTVIGFIYYHPKVLGTVWMNASGMTEEKMKGANMALIFGLSLLLSFMMSTAINGLVIHQNHIFSTLMNETGIKEAGSPAFLYLENFMKQYGQNFRTFKHGSFHGLLFSIFFVLPLIATNSLFERRGAKYIFVNWGYWAITISLMGGVICHFSKTAAGN